MNRRTFIGLVGGTALVAASCRAKELDPLRIVYFTDVHATPDFAAPEALEKVADTINRMNPDLIIGGGDYIHQGYKIEADKAEICYDIFLAFLKKLNCRAELMIGNHDLVHTVDKLGKKTSKDHRAMFREKAMLKEIYRSFDFRGYHIILLDTIKVTGGNPAYSGYVSKEQINWLRKDLAKIDPTMPIILGSHVPLRTSFMQWHDKPQSSLPRNLIVNNGNDVLKVFEGYNLHLVLQGHLHVNELLQWNHTTFIVGGAVCGRWWKGSNHGTAEGFGTVLLDQKHPEWDYHSYGWEQRRSRHVKLF